MSRGKDVDRVKLLIQRYRSELPLFLQILMQKISISLKLPCIFVNFPGIIKEHEIYAKKERTQHGTEIWFACSPGLVKVPHAGFQIEW